MESPVVYRLSWCEHCHRFSKHCSGVCPDKPEEDWPQPSSPIARIRRGVCPLPEHREVLLGVGGWCWECTAYWRVFVSLMFQAKVCLTRDGGRTYTSSQSLTLTMHQASTLTGAEVLRDLLDRVRLELMASLPTVEPLQ